MINIFIGSGSGSEHKVCMYQTSIIYNFLEINGYNLVKSPNNADFIILNGYPFEENEERIDLLTIGYYKKKYQNAKIVLTGSIPGMMKYLYKYDDFICIGYNEYEKFDELFKHKTSIKDIKVDNLRYFIPLGIESLNIDRLGYKSLNIESKYIYSKDNLKITIDKVVSGDYSIDRILEYDYDKYNYLEDISGEYPIEICTGCGGYCSYCDIRNVAGFVKSVKLEEIINKIKRGLNLGYKEFHFIDEDSASYGLDIGIDFADLLNEIIKLEGDFKIKIFYFEPGRLEKLFGKINPKVWSRIFHFCTPLQTTSPRILKSMNRKYNIDNVINIVGKIKQINPNITITTQFIYGFPGETYEEFISYFKVLPYFDELWFWYYSDRPGTKSINFKEKINKFEMIKRLIFLWKIKSKYINRIYDKNETLEQGLKIFNNRKI